MRMIVGVLVGITVLYLVGLVALVIASIMPGIELRSLAQALLALATFPALVLLPVMLLARRWRVAALLAPAVIGWAIHFAPLLLPRTPAVAVDDSFTVLTFNLQASTQNMDSLSTIIANADADIVALQELSFPAAEHFETALADYPYQALYPRESAFQGQGVFSRFEITDEEYWRNEQLRASLGHLRVTLDIDGTAVDLFNTHPIPPISFDRGLMTDAHSGEINILMQRADVVTTPVLLVGDFNMTRLTDEYRLVSGRYTDTFLQSGRAGFGFSFPARFPLVRLDYVFHDASFIGLDAYPLGESGASDHLPYFARLALK